MLRKIVLIVVLCCFAIACDRSDQIKKPDNLISKNKMSNILYDLYIVNAAKGVNRKLLEAKGVVPETYILTKYNIDSLQFSESNRYYAHKPDVYRSIVDDAKERLEKQKEEYEEIQKEKEMLAKRKRDSITEQTKRKDSIKKAIDSIGIN